MRNLAIILLLTSLFGCYARPVEKTGLEGSIMPSFRLFLADSISYLNTGKIPAGKPTVLFFFGPHCPYSRAQMEEIIEEMESLKGIRFFIFTTSPFSELKKFYAEYHLEKYKNIAAGVDYTNFFGDYFKAPGVPYMAIYGKDRRFRQSFLGKVYGKQIKQIATE